MKALSTFFIVFSYLNLALGGLAFAANEGRPGTSREALEVPTSIPGLAHVMEALNSRIKGTGRALFPLPEQMPPAVHRQFMTYLRAMITAYGEMDRDDGLPMDTVFYENDEKGELVTRPFNTSTSPTDMGMKISFNVGLARFFPQYRDLAISNITKMLDSMENLPKDKETGLLFRLYGIKGAKDYQKHKPQKIGKVVPPQNEEYPVYDADISAIDNWHAYLGLWTLSKLKDPALKDLANRAKGMTDSMHFAKFYDKDTNTVSGNLKFKTAIVDGKEMPEWNREKYSVGYNSEMRQLLLGGYALNIFGDMYKDSAVIKQILRQVRIELSPDEILRTWEGGGFQFALGRINLPEQLSHMMSVSNERMFDKVFRTNLQEVRLPAGDTIRVPKTPSATVSEVSKDKDGLTHVKYEANLGTAENKEVKNANPVKDNFLTVHAAMQLAAQDPVAAAPLLKALESVRGKDSNLPLFNPEKGGWFASATLAYEKEDKKVATATVNPAQPAADGYFLGGALLTLLAPDHLSPTARAFLEEEKTGARFLEVISILDVRDSTRLLVNRPKSKEIR